MLSVYIVTSENGDVEVLSERPRWDWTILNQTVRCAFVNGGDSELVEPGKHLDECPITAERRGLQNLLAADPANEYLRGAEIEYFDGGDQERENCTCGAANDWDIIESLKAFRGSAT